jgi:IS605 OrfB family transposase
MDLNIVPPNSLVPFSEYRPSHFEDGQKKGEYRMRGLRQVRVVIRSRISKHAYRHHLAKKSYIAASARTNNGTTCLDRSNQCVRGIPNIVLCKTSHPVSISKERTYSPYYTTLKAVKSKKLLLPRGTEWHDLHSNSSSGYVTKTIVNSWFSNKMMNHLRLNSQQISSPLSTCSVVGETVKGDIRCFKIRVNPRSGGKRQIRKWMGQYRVLYNTTVEVLRKKPLLNKLRLRNFIALEKSEGRPNPLYVEKKWLLQMKKSVREQAVFEACNHPSVREFKSKKKALYKGETINLSKDAVHLTMTKQNYDMFCSINNAQYRKLPRNFKRNCIQINVAISPGSSHVLDFYEAPPIDWIKLGSVVKAKEGCVKVKPPLECKLHLDPSGHTWLCMPLRQPMANCKSSSGSIVGIDPGIRKALTCWHADTGISLTIASNISSTFRPLFDKSDKLKSMHDETPKVNEKRRNILRRKLLKTNERIRNLRDEMHWKACKFLTNVSDTIVIGKINAKDVMANNWPRNKARLAAICKRELSAISHYQFRTRLAYKCAQHGVRVVFQDEAYTSQTCCHCQKITKVGSSELYRCDHCGVVVDRDANSAANMVIKSINTS